MIRSLLKSQALALFNSELDKERTRIRQERADAAGAGAPRNAILAQGL